MSIEQFYTTHSGYTGQSSVKNTSGVDGKASASSAQGSGDVLGFFDMFLQNALAALEAQKAKEAPQKSEASAASADAEQILDITDPEALAAALNAIETGANDNAEMINENGEIIDSALIETSLEDMPEEDITAVKDILKNTFLIADEKSMRPALNNLQRALQKLENLAAENSEALIVANITPEQITELKTVVENILSGQENTESIEENAEKFAAVVAGLISILPPKAKSEVVTNSKTFFLSTDKGDSNGLIGLKDIQARLNALQSGTDGVKKGTALDAPTTAQSQAADDTASGDSFDDVFKQFLDDTKSLKEGKTTLAESMAAAKTAQNAGSEGAKAAALLGVIKNMASGLNGSMTSPAEFSSSSMQDMGLPVANAPFQSVNAMTALVTHAPHASTPHPATQMVAASMKKLAGNGETKEITLKLDPPELGRVEIKMSFGKDSAVKAVLIAEKPETFMMLQRDAHILERALQDAGLEADGNALSFELSQDGQNFSQDGRHDGARNKTGNGNGSEAEAQDTVIETTMNWHVDPDSGHMRYNILA